MSFRSKRRPGQTLMTAFPVAKYLAVLLVSVNLRRLPSVTRLLPERYGPRALFMLWVALLLFLDWLADRRAAREAQRDKDEHALQTPGRPLNLVSFLALAVPGLLLLDIGAIVHFYLSWIHTQAPSERTTLSTCLMSAGNVLWIYGRVLPSLPFGSIWGIRTARTSGSAEAWHAFHRAAGPIVCLAGALLLTAGTFI